ncbi:MAG: PIN domain-containing protein [Chloroflexi bacterium]|nr:PIN domain-containing protein [Chloroflexota bacterium]MDE2636335.1 PIN domain-containing protein [Chloroflexota bacterium]
MDPVTYILDTNVIADRIRRHPQVIARLTQAGEAGNILGLCDPVRYEVSRGLLKVDAEQKLKFFQIEISPLMEYLALTTDDWQEAARLWAIMRNQGRQFSDVDLLIAALARRLDAVVVTADADFASLSVKSEDWRRSE